jgi:hypothetical protein
MVDLQGNSFYTTLFFKVAIGYYAGNALNFPTKRGWVIFHPIKDIPLLSKVGKL